MENPKTFLILIAVTGDPRTIDIRDENGEALPVFHCVTSLDTAELLSTPRHNLSVRYMEPMLATIHNKLLYDAAKEKTGE